MMKKKNNVFTNNTRLTWLLAFALAFIIGLVPCFMQFGKNGARTVLSAENTPILSHRVENPALNNSAEPPEHHSVFSNLAKNAEYVFALVSYDRASQLLSDSNLFYVDQGKSNEKGELTFDYIPRSYSKATTLLFGETGSSMTEMTWFSKDGQLNVSGNGAIGDYNNTAPAPWYSIRSSVRTAVVQNGITKIGKNAFTGFSSLTEVSIPETASTVSSSAFSGCTQLEEVTVPGVDTTIETGAFASNSAPVIRGFSGSRAEAFAKSSGLQFEDLSTASPLLGDVDDSGEVEVSDATFILRNNAGIEVPFAMSKKVADVDGDNNVTIMDATFIQEWLAEMKSDYLIGKSIYRSES